MAIILEPSYIISGSLSLIVVIISLYVGIRIALRYIEHRRRVFLLFGLTAIFVSEPWWPSAFGFLVIFLSAGEINLSIEVYLTLGVVFIPALTLIWLTAFTDLVLNEYQKYILVAFAVYGVIYWIVFFFNLAFNLPFIGDISGYFDPNYGGFVRFYQISLLVVIGITGIIFSKESSKSDDPELRLQGKLFLMGIFSFLAGGMIDIFALLEFPSIHSIILVIIARTILLSCEFEFYCGLMLPEWFKKIVRRFQKLAGKELTV